MLNPFFLNGSKSEQNLLQDLINEQLKIYGIDVYYLPRQYVTEKDIMREVIESKFTFAYPIEAYVDTYDGYGGQGTILSKFGIQELDDLTIIISKDRWVNYLEPLVKNLADVKLSSRPKEGDLIYFPLGDKLFEIKYVEHEKPFYQLQENYVYELRCELFRYGDEIIDTNIDDIDNNVDDDGYIQTIQLVGIGQTATVEAEIVNGGVRFVEIINRGYGYTSVPKVAFSKPTGEYVSERTAVGIATMIKNIVDFCETDENLYRIQGVELEYSGFGYSSAPLVSFIGGGGKNATAKSYIGDGVIGKINILNGGSGYSSPPPVSFIGISSVPASAVSIINEQGQVVSVRMKNAGLGYTEAPQVVIGDPTISTGTGSFIYNEVVVGSASSAKARVKSWNIKTEVIELGILTGNFSEGEILIGQESGANYQVFKINTNNIKSDGITDSQGYNNMKDKYASNLEIEEQSDTILDFSESNPFGNP